MEDLRKSKVNGRKFSEVDVDDSKLMIDSCTTLILLFFFT